MDSRIWSCTIGSTMKSNLSHSLLNSSASRITESGLFHVCFHFSKLKQGSRKPHQNTYFFQIERRQAKIRLFFLGDIVIRWIWGYFIYGLGRTTKSLLGYRSADRYVGISYIMRTRKQLDVYIDESGNFAPFSSFNRIYSVSFVFAEASEEVEQQKAFLRYVQKMETKGFRRWIFDN